MLEAALELEGRNGKGNNHWLLVLGLPIGLNFCISEGTLQCLNTDMEVFLKKYCLAFLGGFGQQSMRTVEKTAWILSSFEGRLELKHERWTQNKNKPPKQEHTEIFERAFQPLPMLSCWSESHHHSKGNSSITLLNQTLLRNLTVSLFPNAAIDLFLFSQLYKYS